MVYQVQQAEGSLQQTGMSLAQALPNELLASPAPVLGVAPKGLRTYWSDKQVHLTFQPGGH